MKTLLTMELSKESLEKAKKFNGNWFKRPDLVINDAPIPSVIESLKELIAENEGKIAVLVTGEGKNTDAAEMLKVLRAMGMEKVLVESPTYCHHMMREPLLDEIFINTSCIFVGGQATGIGTSSKSFPSTDHPHSEIVTMHMHSPHFIYTRYKMLYGIK